MEEYLEVFPDELRRTQHLDPDARSRALDQFKEQFFSDLRSDDNERQNR